MRTFALGLLLVAVPLAVAGQNIAIFLAGLLLIAAQISDSKSLKSKLVVNKVALLHAGFFATYVFWCMFATWYNNDNFANPVLVTAGFLGLWVLPVLIGAAGENVFDEPYTLHLGNIILSIFIGWGLLALSQMMFGWKLSGVDFVPAINRAQGFYSHPLTLAYVAVMIFPYVVVPFFRNPKNWRTLSAFLAITVLLIASKSRTAQAVALLVLLGNVWLLFRGKVRWIAIGTAFFGIALTFSTKNPISQRFYETIEGHDVRGDFVDDRVGFWIVHWDMFKERPLVGHGENLDTKYRTKYYEKNGLRDFERKYEAHNVFLQILVNSGLIGMLLFLVWISWLLLALYRMRDAFFGTAAMQSVLAMLLGGVTQNSFQDSEVRYILIFAVLYVVVASSHQRHRFFRLN